MKYTCKCDYETEWNESDFAEKGEPVCPMCGDDMKAEA
jgi:hypothetical protein